MINLIKNELFKIFKKKSTYITILVFVGLLTLLNFALSYDVNTDYNDYMYSEDNISYLTESLQELNPSNSDEVEIYVSLKTELEYVDFCSKYEKGSWQRTVAEEYSYEIIYAIVESQYLYKDSSVLAKSEAELQELQTKLDADDFKSFMNDKKEIYEATIANNKELLAVESDKARIKELEKTIKTAEINLEVTNYRINNDIKFDNSYLDEALKYYETNKIYLLDFNAENMSKTEENEYKQVQKEVALNKYVIDNKADVNSFNTARNIFLTVISDDMMFIIIFVVMIAGSIVAEEFSKGTIKMLLIRPYSRLKIIAAKYISCLLMLLFINAIIILTQFLLGGIFLGFDSYNIPAIVYNFATESLIEMSAVKYIATQFVAYLPMFLILLTLSFTVSTLFTSTALSVTISLLTMFFSSIINALIIQYKIKVLSIFPTMCWDISSFLYGGTHAFEYTSFGLCLGMSVLYIIIMLLIIGIVFKKKNIKNI